MSVKINRRTETVSILEAKLKARRTLVRKQLIELVEHCKTESGISYKTLNDRLKHWGYHKDTQTLFDHIKRSRKDPPKELIRGL